MTSRSGRVLAAALFSLALAALPAAAQTYQAPRTPDGKPDLNGIWQAVGTAHWDLESHPAKQGPVIALGAAFSIPAGQGVVEGGAIPYKPEAAAKKKENADNWLTRDPEVKCYLPGVPRSTYMPYPFQIVQTPKQVMMVFEYAGAVRSIYMTPLDESPVDTWMGQSVGKWEGNTLVVDSTGFNGQAWFDRAGNFASEKLHVVERFTRTGPDHLMYEATIEDPNVFTRPWKIKMPLYRRIEKPLQLLEYKCVEFAEELLYGHLRKKSTSK
jgi:hypothetical protein